MFDTATPMAHEGYLAGCRSFNADQAHRRSSRCERIHVPLELYRWEELAAAQQG